MSEIRWRGMTHREIYDAVWTGPGPDGSTEPERLWAFVDEALSDVADTLSRGVAQARGGWTGTAAENATTKISSLALKASEAAAGASRLKGAVIAQGEYVGYVRNTLPKPVPGVADVVAEAGILPLLNPFMLDDWQALEQAHSEHAQQAVHVMETYESNTEVNKPYIQSFAAPAAVTTGGVFGGINSLFGSMKTTIGQLVAAAGSVAAGGAVPPGGSPVAVSAAAGGAAAGLPVGFAGGAVIPPAAGAAAGPPRPGIGAAAGRVPAQVVPGAVVTPPGTVTGAVRPPQVPGTGGVSSGSTPIASRGGIGGVRPGGIGSGGIGSGGIGSGGVGGSSSLPRGIPGGFGGVEPTAPRGGLPGGLGAEGEVGRPAGTSPTASPTTATNSTSAGRTGSHGFFPPGGGAAGGGQSREHRRPPYLIDDTDAFGDDRYFTPQVITPDDYIPRRT